MGSKDIINTFGFNLNQDVESIYEYSPVYKVGHYIIKRTQSPLQKALNLMNYTTYLKEHHVPIVTPVNLHVENPQSIEGKSYVVYPFIAGSDYEPSLLSLKQSGELLGRIHSLSPKENEFNLPMYDVFDFNTEEVEEHIEKISSHSKKVDSTIDVAFLEGELKKYIHTQTLLQKSELPSLK
ncbi:phosphotransferase [Alkalicoccobacillus murimartini]|uniref:Aminoglycoside phosphotransferase domain-containing protein n=1 Tax=Alkalicoccobacillus murimartini TaxID=171685 RepID=A0ABT9YMJ1_9BACI|nr:phosphotransferase [Alkalicoccobacillus murimartini]MDQ0209088.1 hypothetical protein [Alkalicoccobacillus murimartini]